MELSHLSLTSMHSSRTRTAHLLPVSPSMHCAGGGGLCLLPEGVSASGSVCFLGVCLLPRGCVCFPGVSASWWGVCFLGGVSASGGCLLPGGVCFPGGGVSAPGGVSQHALRQTPRMTDRCENITPFVGGNKREYRSGTVNLNTVNLKFHLIRSYCEYLARILSFHV